MRFIKYLGDSLHFVYVFKVLGVYVDVKLRFRENVDLVVGRAKSMISSLLRCTVCLSTKFMVSLWVSHFRPFLGYGSCVWNVKCRRDWMWYLAVNYLYISECLY